nr:hypothetical protein Ade03nite_61130 [Actinoplanes derwentensis]
MPPGQVGFGRQIVECPGPVGRRLHQAHGPDDRRMAVHCASATYHLTADEIVRGHRTYKAHVVGHLIQPEAPPVQATAASTVVVPAAGPPVPLPVPIAIGVRFAERFTHPWRRGLAGDRSSIPIDRPGRDRSDRDRMRSAPTHLPHAEPLHMHPHQLTTRRLAGMTPFMLLLCRPVWRTTGLHEF